MLYRPLFIVRIQVIEVEKDGTEVATILEKDIESFQNAPDAVTYAQKVWRKFFRL
jgi:hypothetical protein